jgi:hypothetical protein
VIHFLARTFNLHPEHVKNSFTLRQAMSFMSYEIDMINGEFKIIKSSKKKPEDMRALRVKAMKFFTRAQEKSDGETV